MISIQGALYFMVILSFYRFLIGTIQSGKTKYTLFMKNDTKVDVKIDLNDLAYCADNMSIYGVCQKEGKNIIQTGKLKVSNIDTVPLFSLSRQNILYPAVSPDHQKIAFIAQDKISKAAVLRVILKEEFGWFPISDIKLPASASPVCFSSQDIVIFTDDTGALKAVRLSKKPKTILLHEKGIMPAYSTSERLLAFVNNDKIICTGSLSDELPVNNISVLCFSNDGKNLFYAQENRIYKYSLAQKQIELFIKTDFPVIFFTELQ